MIRIQYYGNVVGVIDITINPLTAVAIYYNDTPSKYVSHIYRDVYHEIKGDMRIL